jgi:hypothetical protein
MKLIFENKISKTRYPSSNEKVEKLREKQIIY